MSKLKEAKAEKRSMLAVEYGDIAREMNDVEKEIDDWNEKLENLQEHENTESQQDSAREKISDLKDRFNNLKSKGEELGKKYKKLQGTDKEALRVIGENFKKRIALLVKYANIYQELFGGEIGFEIASEAEAEATRLEKLLREATKEVQEKETQ
ncbi:hypothetical protein ACFLS5_01795 [Candidatus Bipolaricaulota bacterium]